MFCEEKTHILQGYNYDFFLVELSKFQRHVLLTNLCAMIGTQLCIHDTSHFVPPTP